MTQKNKVTVIYHQHMAGWGASDSERDYDSLEEAEAEVQRIVDLNDYSIDARIKKQTHN